MKDIIPIAIKIYKGYQYIIYDNGYIYFYGSIYINHKQNLERSIKALITKTKNEYDRYNNYYKSAKYCNSLVLKELKRKYE